MTKFLKFVPVQLTFWLILGIIVGNFVFIKPIYLVVILTLLICMLLLAYLKATKLLRPSLIFTLLVFLISFFIGISAITYKNQLNSKLHYSNSSEFSLEKQVTMLLKICKILKPTNFYNKYEATVLQLEGKKVIGKILVNVKKDSLNKQLEIDTDLIARTSYENISDPLNPYNFNYKKYLKNHHIYHQIKLHNQEFLVFQKRDETLKGVAAKIRNSLIKSLKNNGFKKDELAVITALLLGQRNSITKDLMQHYTSAGAIHILAVSGLHIGIILLLLLFIFKPIHNFKNGKYIAAVLIVLILWVYAVIAGLSASIVRAVTMFSILTIGLQLNRRSNVYNTLIVSVFILLLFNPFYLFEVGFQLSYLAVFAIVWIQPKLYGLWKPKLWLLTKIWQLFTVSIAAQIGILPLSLFYFHQFPGLFFLSNLIIIPFLGTILFLGIIVIFLSFFEILPQFLGDFYSYVIHQMNNFVGWVAQQDFFIIKNISFSLALMFLFYVFIFSVMKWTEKRNFLRYVLVLVSIISIQLIVIFEKYKLQSTNEFIVFNNTKNSLIAQRFGNNLTVSSNNSLYKTTNVLKTYLVGTGTERIHQHLKLKNLYKFHKETILVVDSLEVYDFKSIKPSIIILRQSPKINIERLLKKLKPQLLVADGSNYKSYVAKWRQTCLKNKTPFYYTVQKGAFILK
ncbi:ComEC/Rec2 family competence protein [Lutibacter sp.]|uniref:ComEC/Rec2 family competence protein n=1 Tax=Lutibacter sp. TaxID=1925666 RepID=UPI0025C30D35|nr:ComEC/Rec2 family competence protein [Lutibacter sp.]MCF6168265.1 ComEC family competence protein [Lutibacter sp.]